MAHHSNRIVALIPIFALAWACGGDVSENRYRRALPSEDVLTVDVPEMSSQSQGLLQDGAAVTARSALVGEPADFYVSSYYEARRINLFGRAVLAILEAITDNPPTVTKENRAVWGPFRDEREPNEFRLWVEERAQPETHFVWQLQGRPVSGGPFTFLAGGAYEPTGTDLGRGWFVVHFDAIATLDPTEDGRGTVAYAFAKNHDGVAVRLVAVGLNDTGDDEPVAYAFGENTRGFGYILFAFAEDVHEGAPGQTTAEDLVVRTRWRPSGEGRADVLAVRGDLGAGFVQVSQCWDDTFVSRYEILVANGATVAEDGDPASCVFDGDWPAQEDLPDDGELANPFEE